MCLHVVFFFKQKTAYEMRISDWSSDVCSSDLIVDPAQLDRQLHDWNDTARPRSLRDTVQGRFEEMRHRSPDALAVVDATKSFTYAELDRRAARLASRLRAAGVVAGDVVEVAMERSAGAVVAVLATAQAGCGDLALGVSLPEETRPLHLS